MSSLALPGVVDLTAKDSISADCPSEKGVVENHD